MELQDGRWPKGFFFFIYSLMSKSQKTLKNFTKINKSLQKFTKIHKTSQNFTKIHKSLQNFKKNFTKLHQYDPLLSIQFINCWKVKVKG